TCCCGAPVPAKTPLPGRAVRASRPKPAYSAAGQATLHAMAILQVHQAISQAGLFRNTFLGVQKQTEAIKHILSWRESTKLPGARVASTPALPPATPKEATPQTGRQTERRRAVQSAAQGSATNTRKTAKR
ncbi:hypothetical protein M9458_029677, partial [Cirrhinus mrigala]